MTAVIKPGRTDDDRFDRAKRIGWINLDRVKASNCLVVGAGALGNEVVKNLVLSGVQSITVVDMDFVVRSNLNRCIFFRDDDATVKRAKAIVIAERARELNPYVVIDPIVMKLEDMNLEFLDNFAVVFGCLDNISARLHLNAYAYREGVPYIDGGMDGTLGKVQVVISPHTPCLQCTMNLSHSRALNVRYSCTGSEVSVYIPKTAAEITTTSIIGAIQVREGLKILSGKTKDCITNVFYYDGLRNRYEMLEVSRDPSCPVHI
ncbi:MAG: ThiF family adenylyltransferase [Methanomassiliicoccales archaeon]